MALGVPHRLLTNAEQVELDQWIEPPLPAADLDRGRQAAHRTLLRGPRYHAKGGWQAQLLERGWAKPGGQPSKLVRNSLGGTPPAGLLMVPGLGFAFAGIFPLPNPIHWLAGATLVFLGSIPAFFITGRLLRPDPAWRPWGTYAVVTGAATAALVAAMFALANPDSPAASLPITGLAERAVFAVMLAWYVATGWRVFRDLPQASRRRSP